MRGSRGRLRLLGHPSDVLPQWYLTLRRSDAMGTCQGQRDKECSTGLRGCSPHATGKPPGQPRRPAPLTFPVPVVCPSQCCGLQGRHSAPRRAHGPSAEPQDALPRTPSVTVNTTPLPRRRGTSGAARPLAGLPARAKPPYGLHASSGRERQGRAAGGVAPRLPPPRPAPGLREPLASEAARRKSPQLAQQTRPRAAPRPHPRPPPRCLLRSLGVSPVEPAQRPAAGVRQGRNLRQGQRPLLQREKGVAPCKMERAYWSGVLGRAPAPHEAFWLVGSNMGRSLSRGPGAAR